MDNIMESLYHFCIILIAQAQTQWAEGNEGAQEAVAENPGGFFGPQTMLFVLIGIMVFFLFSSMKQGGSGPAGKSELLKNLKKNDKVVTAGGILGTVVNYRSDSEYVTLRIDDSANTRMQVLATSIYRVVSDEDTEKTS